MKYLLLALLTACTTQLVKEQNLEITASLSPENTTLAQSYGFKTNHILLYQNVLDNNSDGLFDAEAPGLIEAFPTWMHIDPLAVKIISLDWEGPADDNASHCDPVAIGELLKGLREVKRVFPNAKVGYYNMPRVSYWESDGAGGGVIVDDQHRALVDAANVCIRPILDEMTAWFPSMYQFYPSWESGMESRYLNNQAQNLQYVRWNTDNVLKIRGARDVPIYPYVWPRFHNSNAIDGGRLIYRPDFEEYMRAHLSTEVNGRKIDGLLWWDSDRYALSVATTALAVPVENRTPLDLSIIQDMIKMCGAATANWENCINSEARETIELFKRVFDAAHGVIPPVIPPVVVPQTVIRTEAVSDVNATYATEQGLQTAFIFYGWTLNRNGDAVWDGPVQFEASAKSVGLKTDYTGNIVLDVEGPMEELMAKGDVAAKNEMLTMLRYVKHTYPRAKVGFYGVPRTAYWGEGDIISDSNHERLRLEQEAYADLTREVTGYYPSLYQYYSPLDAPYIHDQNLRYLRWNVKNLLTLRGEGTQPLLVFTWPRFHGCCTTHRDELIPRSDFMEQLQTILNETVDDKKVDGLMWWGADKTALRVVGNSYGVFQRECGMDATKWDACIDVHHKETIDIYKSALLP